jgi:hypothetical protein
VQDEIGIASNLPMADDKRTRVVAKQHLLARQQRRLEVCDHGKSGSLQMVDTVRPTRCVKRLVKEPVLVLPPSKQIPVTLSEVVTSNRRAA